MTLYANNSYLQDVLLLMSNRARAGHNLLMSSGDRVGALAFTEGTGTPPTLPARIVVNGLADAIHARAIARRVAEVVSQWRKFFADAGVIAADMEYVQACLDATRLAD